MPFTCAFDVILAENLHLMTRVKGVKILTVSGTNGRDEEAISTVIYGDLTT